MTFASFSGSRALLRALLFAPLLVSCSSGSFDVAQATGDSGVVDDTDGDTGVSAGDSGAGDSSADPCAPVTGVGKLCIDVLAFTPHPAYGSANGGPAVGADGHGTIKVYLYDTDPSQNSPAPIGTINYPSDGTQIAPPEQKAVTLVSGAVEGTLYFIAVFQDAPRSATDPTVLPGDFVSIPEYDATTKKAAYTPVAVKAGTTSRFSLTVRPVRRIDTAITISDDLWGRILTSTGTVNPLLPKPKGDGPFLYFLFDGDIGTPSIVDIALTPCLDLGFQKTSPDIPPNRPIGLATVAPTGTHNVFGALVDYGLSDTPFPGAGSLITDTGGDPTLPAPTVVLTDTSWLSTPGTVKGALTLTSDVQGAKDTAEAPYAICPGK